MPIFEVELEKTITVNTLVYAKDRADARKVANDKHEVIFDDAKYSSDDDISISIGTEISSHEALENKKILNNNPYSEDDEDMTCKEFLEREIGTVEDEKAKEFNQKFQTTLTEFTEPK